MIKIHKRIFYEIFDKNIDMYMEYIETLNVEYSKIITKLSITSDIPQIRYYVHKLIGILNNFYDDSAIELIYYCKLLLNIDKKNPLFTIDDYKEYINLIVNYDKTLFGL
jgi:hypothetical protein